MKTYRVTVRESHYTVYFVEARTWNKAKAKVEAFLDGKGPIACRIRHDGCEEQEIIFVDNEDASKTYWEV